ncbi:hypothetical protein Nepgr_010189 [Nepenthes gracilis]|uniref:Uncharacterized protein n=1 Tax=Nepenthes gracilis TaxID=150966 RepID=A0AAD3SCF9_NEPGR|nr:hypothetical protein Nepgr_010189 [Nepenthes gracilis]
MASSVAKIMFRAVLAVLLITILFFVGRPLYWKISATVHDIRQNKRTVSEGISQIVQEAQKFSGWFHDESDSGVVDELNVKKISASSTRKILYLMTQGESNGQVL